MNQSDKLQEAAEAYALANPNLMHKSQIFIAGAEYALSLSKPEKEEEWISVETKLPAAGLDVLVADIESDIVCTGWHIEPEGWFTNVIGVTVTHWTKLPKSPK